MAILLVLASCRQLIGIDDPSITAGDAPNPHDAAFDAPDALAPATCRQRWLSAPIFGAPVSIGSIDTSADEDHPFLTDDELTLYFTRNDDIYRASRQAVTGPFDIASPETSLNSASAEAKVFVNDDATRVFFSSDRTGGSGGFDLLRGARNGGGAYSVDRQYLDNLNDSSSQHDPFMSSDLLRVYYATGSTISRRLAFATRGNTSQNFGASTALLSNVTGFDTSPSLALDETVLVFASTRSGGVSHLHFATRPGLNGTFTTPVEIAGLSMPGGETSPHVSANGCRLYFVVTTGAGGRDVMVATML